MSALVACGLSCALADTIQLKDKAAITGKVLAEKSDHIAVDIGYTVLVIPRNQVIKILRSDSPAPVPRSKRGSKSAVATAATDTADPKAGFYSTPAKPTPARTVLELVNQIGEAVVQVRTPGGLGSGFFLNEDGFLITNFHVIEGETQITVEVYHQKEGQLDRKTYKQVRIIALNKFADLALLRVEDKDAPKFRYVPLGSSDGLSVGERVFAIGSPLGLERTVTEGILSTKTREVGGLLYLQTTAQINPGNSGGPLFNLSGEVMGVTNMKVTAGEGLGFAIPVETVRYFLDHRDAFAYANDNPSNPYRYLEPPSRTRQTRVEE
ncbi:MAG TPA: trypsin-like peptidase domain-containing protein [Candidatus Paceibacterota bacterium]|nr:trypsin-like peptidase domain-containing protein [Candidatus Paceibacterota bacterium]